MSKFFYWRRGRAHNANTLHVVFWSRETGESIHSHVKSLGDGTGTWEWYYQKPFSTLQGKQPSQEKAQEEIEKIIAWEFRPENAY